MQKKLISSVALFLVLVAVHVNAPSAMAQGNLTIRDVDATTQAQMALILDLQTDEWWDINMPITGQQPTRVSLQAKYPDVLRRSHPEWERPYRVTGYPVPVIVFVLALYHLPRFGNLSSAWTRARDASVALTAGALITLMALTATSVQVTHAA